MLNKTLILKTLLSFSALAGSLLAGQSANALTQISASNCNGSGSACLTVPPVGNTLGLTVFNTATNSGGTLTIDSLTSTPGGTTYGYTNTYTSLQSTPVFTSTSGNTYGFYDDYVFSIGANQVDDVTTSLSLNASSQISNLSERLYSLNAAGSTAPLLTTGVSAIQGWSSSTLFAPGVTFSTTIIGATTPVVLGAGTYVLEVRGTATGTSGGTYSGNLNLEAVPLPASIWLLGSAALGLAGLARRRIGA